MLSPTSLKAWGLSDLDIKNLMSNGENRKPTRLCDLIMGLYRQATKAELTAEKAKEMLIERELELTLLKYHTVSLYAVIGSLALYIALKRS